MAEKKKNEAESFETRYIARVTFSEEMIKRTSVMRYDVFHLNQKLVLYAVSALCVVAGLFLIPDKGFAVCMIALGCVMITSGNMKPNSMAKQALKELNGKFPTLNYFFAETGYKFTGAMDAESCYGDVKRLVEDDKYFYIFLASEAAHVIEKDAPKNTDGEPLAPDVFKAWLAEKTGLPWTRPLSWKNVTLWHFLANRKERRSGRDKWEERLPDQHR